MTVVRACRDRWKQIGDWPASLSHKRELFAVLAESLKLELFALANGLALDNLGLLLGTFFVLLSFANLLPQLDYALLVTLVLVLLETVNLGLQLSTSLAARS
jgi:hypothetical protein